MSNNINNEHSPVVVVAAITSAPQKRNYPQNVDLPAGALPRDGTIYGGQLYTIDKTRLQSHRGTLDAMKIAELDRALIVSLGLPRLAGQ